MTISRFVQLTQFKQTNHNNQRTIALLSTLTKAMSIHHNINKKPTGNRFNQNFNKPKLSLGVLLLAGTILGQTAVAAPEIPIGEHNTEVDISQPIEALNKLESVKAVEPITMSLPQLQHFTTDNGVPVIFVQTEQLPIVDVEIRFNAGSARDGENKHGKSLHGLASLTASMLTKGTKQLDETEYAKTSEQLGIELYSAAYKDQFAVSLRSLSDDEHLKPALDLMSDVITKPRFDADVLARSKAQQMLGLKQMLQSPAYIASTVFSQELYQDHPYAHASYGTVETIPNITVEDLQRFKQRYLVARNATLSITGDVSLNEAKKIANRVTENLSLGQSAPVLPKPVPPKFAKHVHVNYDSDQTSVMIGQLGYALDPSLASSLRQTQFSIGNEILAGGGFHSRLMGKVRKELGYTYGIYGNMTAMQTNGPYVIRFSTRNEKAADAITATLDTINNTLDKGVTDSEFELTTQNLINSYPMGFASNASINKMLGTLNFNKLPDSYLTGYIERIKQSDKTAVEGTLAKTLTPDKFIIVTVGEHLPLEELEEINTNASQSSNMLTPDITYNSIEQYEQMN